MENHTEYYGTVLEVDSPDYLHLAKNQMSPESLWEVEKRLAWVPHKVRERIEERFGSSKLKRQRAIAFVSMYMTKSYRQRRYGDPFYQWVQFHSVRDVRRILVNFHKEIIGELFDVNHSYSIKGNRAKKYSLKKEFIDILEPIIIEDSDKFYYDKKLETEIYLNSKSMINKTMSIEDIKDADAYMWLKIQKLNSDKWCENLRRKLLSDRKGFFEKLLKVSKDRKSAIETYNNTVVALFGDWSTVERADEDLVKEFNLSEYNRPHTPANCIPAVSESILLGKPIFKFDIKNCHLVFLAAQSRDENLMRDLEQGEDIYNLVSISTHKNPRESAKRKIQILLNDREKINESCKVGKVFAERYPVSFEFIRKLKEKKKAFHCLGNDGEQKLMRETALRLPERVRKDIKFEHDGMASLSEKSFREFIRVFGQVLAESSEILNRIVKIKTHILYFDAEIDEIVVNSIEFDEKSLQNTTNSSRTEDELIRDNIKFVCRNDENFLSKIKHHEINIISYEKILDEAG